MIELLLYVSLVSVILLSVSVLYSALLSSGVKNQTVADVEGEGMHILHLITQTIRNARAINSPVPGASAASLSLNVADAAKNPTIFDLASSTLRIKEGGSQTIPLTSSRILISGLAFSNLSRAGTRGTIRIEFTVNRLNPEDRNEYEYPKTFYASASLR